MDGLSADDDAEEPGRHRRRQRFAPELFRIHPSSSDCSRTQPNFSDFAPSSTGGRRCSIQLHPSLPDFIRALQAQPKPCQSNRSGRRMLPAKSPKNTSRVGDKTHKKSRKTVATRDTGYRSRTGCELYFRFAQVRCTRWAATTVRSGCARWRCWTRTRRRGASSPP